MGQIKFVGVCIRTAEQFLDFMMDYKMGAWRPAFVTMHHTGSPDLKIWNGYQVRKPPIPDEKWMVNLAGYYGSPAYNARGKLIKSAWSTGPHFFFTPQNYCVLSPPERPGTHAQSMNANSWGVECVGYFDKGKDAFTGELKQRYIDGLAVLHMVLGKDPGEKFVVKKSGLHFHRDDPLTNKTCPGTGVDKADVIKLTRAAMARLTGNDLTDPKGSDQAMGDKVVPVKNPKAGKGVVKGLSAGDKLNIRAGAGAKNPAVGQLAAGDFVEIVGEAKNGTTLWLEIDIPGDANGYIAAQYVDRV